MLKTSGYDYYSSVHCKEPPVTSITQWSVLRLPALREALLLALPRFASQTFVFVFWISVSFSRTAVYLPTAFFFWLVSFLSWLVICVSYLVEILLFFIFFWGICFVANRDVFGCGRWRWIHVCRGWFHALAISSE